jgi:hypothetical protein
MSAAHDINRQKPNLGRKKMKAYLKTGAAPFVLASAMGAAVALAADSQSQFPAAGEKVAGRRSR